MEQTNNTKMLTIIEAEKLIGVSRYSIEYKCRNGLIPGAELRDGDCFIPLQWVSQQRNMIDMSNMLTTTEAHNPCPSFQDLCRMGQVPGVELIGRTYYIPKKWLEKNKHKVYGDYLRYQRHQHSKIYKIGRHDGKLSLRQVSEIVGVCHMTIICAIKKGQLIQDGEGFSLQSLEKYIESKYNRKSEHNLLTIPFAALLLGVEVNVIDAAIETGNITLLKNNKINIDKLESVLKTGDGLTTKEAAVKAKVPRSAIYLALTVGQISYNNGDGIRVEELTAFAEKSPLAGCTEQPTADNDEEVSKKENTRDNSFLTFKEAAEFAGVSYATILWWLHKGKIQESGKAIKREEIIKYMQKRQKPKADFERLTRTEAAQIAGVPAVAIRTAIKSGKITTSGRGVTPDELLIFLKKGKLREFGYIDEETLSIDQAAKIVGVTRQTICRARDKGHLKTSNGGFQIAELKRYTKACRGIDIDVPPVPDVEPASFGFLNQEEAAQIAGVSLLTLDSAVKFGLLRKIGKYILRSDLDKYIVGHDESAGHT